MRGHLASRRGKVNGSVEGGSRHVAWRRREQRAVVCEIENGDAIVQRIRDEQIPSWDPVEQHSHSGYYPGIRPFGRLWGDFSDGVECPRRRKSIDSLGDEKTHWQRPTDVKDPLGSVCYGEADSAPVKSVGLTPMYF